MEKQNKPKSSFAKRLTMLITNNLLLKILSLVFAMLLWGYVLTDINPQRIKNVQDVSVSFDGEADLIARGLVVRGAREEILSPVDVRVRTELTKYADLTAGDVSATISLKNISMAGTPEIPVTAYSSAGAIEGVTPSRVPVEIDYLATKNIPVEVQLNGTLPDGYWADTPKMSRSEVSITGAATDVNMVSRAVCNVNLDGCTKSYNDAVNVVLLDKNSNEIDPTLFIGETAAVTVRMQVLPKKTVTINVDNAILGQDNLPPTYEIFAVTANPATVDIVGAQDALAAVSELELEGISVAGATQSIHETVGVKLPEGIQMLGTQQAEVFVDIREKQIAKDFVQIPVNVLGLGDGLKVELNPELIDVELKGRTSLIKTLGSDDISLFVDITGLGEGTYNISVQLETKDPEILTELTPTYSVQTPLVRIIKE